MSSPPGWRNRRNVSTEQQSSFTAQVPSETEPYDYGTISDPFRYTVYDQYHGHTSPSYASSLPASYNASYQQSFDSDPYTLAVGDGIYIQNTPSMPSPQPYLMQSQAQHHLFPPTSIPDIAAQSPYGSQAGSSPGSINFQLSTLDISNPNTASPIGQIDDLSLENNENQNAYFAAIQPSWTEPSLHDTTHIQADRPFPPAPDPAAQTIEDSNHEDVYTSQCPINGCDDLAVVYGNQNKRLKHCVEVHSKNLSCWADLFPSKCLWEGCMLGKIFENIKSWLGHMKVVHLKAHFCDVLDCSYKKPFGSKAMVKRHKEQTHGEMVFCNKPGCHGKRSSKLARRDKLIEHNLKWHGPLDCTVPSCSRRRAAGVDHGFSSRNDLDKHLQEKHSMYLGEPEPPLTYFTATSSRDDNALKNYSYQS